MFHRILHRLKVGYPMQTYQIEKYFYTRTKNIVPTDTGGKELFLFASLVIEKNQPIGDSTRKNVKTVISKLYEKPVEASPSIYLELANDTILKEVTHKRFTILVNLAETDEYSFFLFPES